MSGDDAWRPPRAPAAPPAGDAHLLAGYASAVEVARGADSIVYRARQVALGRDVAVKVLQVDDPATAARFRRELEITVRLGRQHPHIVTVLDTGVTADGKPCIVMEYLERGSLQDVLRATGPMPSADVVRVGKVVADALAYAHAQGVLHRDVKPQNVLVLPTSWVLADFGIARLADSTSTASVEQFSYRHAAPQVLDGLPPTTADDVWSLGSTLFTLLDGRPPFASDDPHDDTALAYLRRSRTEQARPLDRVDLPVGLADVIERCLRKDPAERFASADDLHRALARVEGESGGWAPEQLGDATGIRPDDRETPEPAVPDATPAGGGPDAPATPPVSAPDPPSPAVSALAHARTSDRRDAAPTGQARDDEPAGPESPSDRESPTRATGLLGTTGRRVGVGLLAGAAIGVALVVLTSRGEEPIRSAGTPTSNTVPTVTLGPSLSASPVPPVAEPALRPIIVDARGRGTSVTLEWTDPSGGAATFFVTQVGVPDPRVVAQFGPGTTSGTVEGVDPQAARVCYVVGALAGQDAATSAERCLDPSP